LEYLKQLWDKVLAKNTTLLGALRLPRSQDLNTRRLSGVTVDTQSLGSILFFGPEVCIPGNHKVPPNRFWNKYFSYERDIGDRILIGNNDVECQQNIIYFIFHLPLHDQ